MRNPAHTLLSNTETHLPETAYGRIILCDLSLSTSAPIRPNTDSDFHLIAIEMTAHSHFGVWPKELWISPLVVVLFEK